jgi:bacillithiol system protein YtxJ
MADIEEVTNLADWEFAWDDEQSEDAGALLILKYSPVCPTSVAAEDIFRHFVKELPSDKDLRVLAVDVISQRPISQQIAADTGVQHESPQALLISRGGNVIWHASHMDITSEAMREALAIAHV